MSLSQLLCEHCNRGKYEQTETRTGVEVTQCSHTPIAWLQPQRPPQRLQSANCRIPGKSAWVGKFGLASYGYPNNPESEDWFCTARICHPDSLHEFCLKHVFLVTLRRLAVRWCSLCALACSRRSDSRAWQSVGSELNFRRFFFFVNFSPALYYLNA